MISIVIPTLNSIKDISSLFISIRDNKIQDKAEIIIVDAGSTDGTVELVKRYNIARLINTGFVSKGKGRNIGIKASKGDIIVNTDSDVKFLPGWIEAIEESMKNNDIVVGYSPDPKGKQLPRVPIYVDGLDITWPTCNIAHKKKVFDVVGYYDETQNLPEDCEFNLRCVKAGYTIHYNPKMKLFHNQRTSWKGFCKQAFWNGEARYELNNLHPELKHLHQHGVGCKNLFRLGFGACGYFIGRYYKKKGEKI